MIRLLTSNHVKDLQVIVQCTFVFWAIAVIIIIFAEHNIETHAMLGTLTVVAGGVLSWVYQTGSNRLGTVDLFACEISAICRSCFVVDLGRATVAMLSQPFGQNPRNFASVEQYTPVCDKVLPDLQPLGVTVIEAVTEFYNYRSAMMDYLRAAVAETDSCPMHRHLVVMMLYMQFLMYESAHNAIHELIEFEPNREESLINILCCGLSVYKFLRSAPDFRDRATGKPDYRAKRLELRAETYSKDVWETFNSAREYGSTGKWKRAFTTAPELQARYVEVFEKWPPEVPEGSQSNMGAQPLWRRADTATR
jgi:hypothetical protein